MCEEYPRFFYNFSTSVLYNSLCLSKVGKVVNEICKEYICGSFLFSLLKRTAAADCLLKLPSLTLMASTRPHCEGATAGSGDKAGGGLHVSATLSAFSLNVYSPHQVNFVQSLL